MAWISLTVVLLVFYLPSIGLADRILAQSSMVTISLPWIAFNLPLAFLNDLKVFIFAFLSWLVIWVVLVGLLRILPSDHLYHRVFNGDDLFAVRPVVTIRMANWLSLGVLGVLAIYLVILIVVSILSIFISALSTFNTTLLSIALPTQVFVIAGLIQIAMRAYIFEVSYRTQIAMTDIQAKLRQSSDIALPAARYE
jgi:hypothetical protein